MTKQNWIIAGIVVGALALNGAMWAGYYWYNHKPAIVTVPLKTCSVNGDSIAVMIKPYLPACKGTPKGAMDTKWILAHMTPSDVAIISAASNDIKDWHPTKNGKANPDRQLLANKARTNQNLEAIRSASKAKKVIWIKPILREPAEAVSAIAKAHGDVLVTYTDSADGVHPRNPKQVAIDIGKAVPELKNIKK